MVCLSSPVYNEQNQGFVEGKYLPTSHPPQRFDAAIDITLALEEHRAGMLDALALGVEVGQCGGPDGLGLVSEGLGGPQTLRRAVEAISAGQKLLTLL